MHLQPPFSPTRRGVVVQVSDAVLDACLKEDPDSKVRVLLCHFVDRDSVHVSVLIISVRLCQARLPFGVTDPSEACSRTEVLERPLLLVCLSA